MRQNAINGTSKQSVLRLKPGIFWLEKDMVLKYELFLLTWYWPTTNRAWRWTITLPFCLSSTRHGISTNIGWGETFGEDTLDSHDIYKASKKLMTWSIWNLPLIFMLHIHVLFPSLHSVFSSPVYYVFIFFPISSRTAQPVSSRPFSGSDVQRWKFNKKTSQPGRTKGESGNTIARFIFPSLRYWSSARVFPLPNH